LNEYGRLIYDSWDERDDLKQLWSDLQDPRNTLDHAGHQRNTFSTETIQKKAQKDIIPQLRALAQRWDLT
jgi:hypothetical protein